MRVITGALKSAAALTLAGSSLAGLSTDEKVQSRWNKLSTLGIVRFGRAAIVVGHVVVDYKHSLRGIDPKSGEYQDVKSQVHLRSAARLRDMCWRNGGCFIKVGQHIGALDYLLPSEYVSTMKILHKDAPRTPIATVRHVIADDLGQGVDELFSSFEEEPIASASLAQVHRATKRGSGEVVAVKVQHPRVKAHSVVDITTMELLVSMVEWIFPEFQFAWLAEEMRKNLPLELDFVHEAHNCKKVAKSFEHLQFLKIPSVDWELSSERVMTMEFCDGEFITDTDYIQANNIDIDDVMMKLGRLYSEMIFVQGYIHCDPHPGNLLVRPSLSGTQIVLLDHGLYQTMSDDVRLNYCRLWQSILRRDRRDMQEHSRRLGVEKMYPLFICIVTGRSWDSITDGVDRSAVTKSETQMIQSSAASYLPQITTILDSMPRQLLLIFKTNDLLRGIETSLRSRVHPSRRTHHTQTAFVTMSRCCVRAVGREQVEMCGGGLLCRWRSLSQMYWILFQLSTYEVFLQVKHWFIGWMPGLRRSLHENVHEMKRLKDVLHVTEPS